MSLKEKNNIRKEILGKRNSLNDYYVNKNSILIIKYICNIIEQHNFNNIMIFMNMNNEVEITRLLNIYSNKNFYIPKTFRNGDMRISKYDKKYLVLHKFGYYESCSEIYEDDSILDLVIIPGIVFDKNKNRIGFGGGYYDKFLYKLKENHNKNNTKLPLIVAVCYDFQLLNSIPYEKHDIKPDIIITEKQTIK